MPFFRTMEEATNYMETQAQAGVRVHIKFNPMKGGFDVFTLFETPPMQKFKAPVPEEEFTFGGLGERKPPAILPAAPSPRLPVEHIPVSIPNLPTMRDYQLDAVKSAKMHPHTLIVLPTGTGKTEVALSIINDLHIPTIIITPQIRLVDQWIARIKQYGGQATGVSSGMGSMSRFSNLTVTTYQSALLNLPEVLRFRLVVFDEVHHLFSPENRKILEAILALPDTTHIIGLTASPREFGAEKQIQDRIFTNRFVMTPKTMQQTQYAVEIEIRAIPVDLDEENRDSYDQLWQTYRNTLKAFNDFPEMVRGTHSQFAEVRQKAFAGMSAYAKMKQMLSELPEKIDQAAEIIQTTPGQFIIFGDTIEMVDTIYNRLRADGIPAIEIHSKLSQNSSERTRVLNALRKGEARVLVGANAIEEGLDLPDLSNAIFVSVFSAGNRKIIQRTGRVLRPSPGKKAVIYILFAQNTVEATNLQKIRAILGIHD